MSSDDMYIVFKEAERPLWWMRWLKDGFSHCFVIRADGNKWLKYESGHGVTRIDSVNHYATLIENGIIVKIQAVERKRWVSLNTCVGFTKLITGIRSWSLTPYQLFKKVHNGSI